jgi:hypothetical protein
MMKKRYARLIFQAKQIRPQHLSALLDRQSSLGA